MLHINVRHTIMTREQMTAHTSPHQASNSPRRALHTHTQPSLALPATQLAHTVKHRAGSGAREPARDRERERERDGERKTVYVMGCDAVATTGSGAEQWRNYSCTFNTINDLILARVHSESYKNAPARFATFVRLLVSTREPIN